MSNPADRPTTKPRTKAGRRLMASPYRPWPVEKDAQVLIGIRAIEAEAAQGAASLVGGLDLEALRIERGWPTPISMRHAADALDKLAIPKYGDVLRWVADLCDGAAPLDMSCDRIVNNGMGEPTECGRSYPCDLHDGGAAPRAEGLDYEALRMERHWPTPDSMRRAADALDELVIPKYGDVLRWVADLCDESLTSRPSDERVPEGED